MAESEEELKNLLMKLKEESEKVCLIFNIQKTKIMASVLITFGKYMVNNANSERLYFGGGGEGGRSKITADGACNHESKRCLLLGRKGMTNLDSIFRSRDITLATNVCLVKAMCFFLFLFLFLFFVFPIAHIWM